VAGAARHPAPGAAPGTRHAARHTGGMGRRLDLLAAAAAALAVAMTAVYLVLLRQEQDRPVPWVLVVLALGAAGSGYGAVVAWPHRRTALWSAGLLLAALGAVAILSIGLPILLAGILCLVAAARVAPSGAPPPRTQAGAG